jgi:glycosyltransferase involved in cell wall biosynthesis
MSLNPTLSAVLVSAFAQRMNAVSAVLLDTTTGTSHHEAGDVLDLLVASVSGAMVDRESVWLLLTALTGALPTSREVIEAARVLELEDTVTSAIWLLERAREVGLDRGNPLSEMDLVTGAVVVDVNQTARSDRHTGIQRVVRQMLPYWDASQDILLAGWTSNGGTLRRLTETEEQAVLRWDDCAAETAPHQAAQSGTRTPARLLIPWNSVIVLPEVPTVDTCPQLAALAELSTNRVVMIGYDAIPIVSADLRPCNEPDLFVKYLNIIKYSSRVAGISFTASEEFRGFSESLRSQGIDGPLVMEVLLAHQEVGRNSGDGRVPGALGDGQPLVLCVGSQEVHKNHLAVMHAAERLWREGLAFQLTFVGRHGWDMSAFDEQVSRLQAAGRPLAVLRGMGDDELRSAYQRARFAIFPSLHEGYGLPVAEALAAGTPVITSDFGSMQEIARNGGCLLVDPHDDEEIVGAMRSLLTDDPLLAELQHQARSRTSRSWEAYAAELWDALVAPELAS